MTSLAKIRSAGFNISLTGDSFAVIPASLLNDSQRAFLKSHKAEIVNELSQEQAANNPAMTSAEWARIYRWFLSIGPDLADEREDLRRQCESDPAARRYFLSRSSEANTGVS